MDTIKLWARNGDAVRQAIELGELVHLDTASEELTDAFLLSLLLDSGVLADQQRNERTKQRFASLSHVVNELEETQVEREFFL